MAKRKARGGARKAGSARKGTARRRAARRPKGARSAKVGTRSAHVVRRRTASAKSKPAHKTPKKRSVRRPKRSVGRPTGQIAAPPVRRPASKVPRLDRARRTLEETVPTPPSSLDLNRHGSAVRTARAELANSLKKHAGMSPAITGGDVDVDVEDAYFTGDGAPGGDNPTPDQDVVDDIGKAVGLQYQDAEELKATDKVIERDKHRWELDPASAEDYKDRK